MSSIKYAIRLSLGAAILGACVSAHAQTTVADWNFGTASAPANGTTVLTPAATGGTAVSSSATTAQDLGMTNSYVEANGATASVSADNITNDTNAPTQVGANSQDVWRVVGGSSTSVPGSTTANGWSTNAPEYTQGAQFTTSTVGYTDVSLQFTWASTKQGIQDLQVQYNLNGNSATGWTSIGPLDVATVGNSSTGGSYATDTVDFGALAANDPDFGVRLVAAFSPNLAGGTEYAAASSSVTSPTEYNNSSGNWRFADVQFDATPVPLPAGLWLLVTGLGGLGALARRRVTA